MKKLLLPIIAVIFMVISPVTASADPYQNYIYGHNGEIQAEPQAVIPVSVITGKSLGTEDFNSPQDVFVGRDGVIYLADTGNNRIVVFSRDCKLVRVITGFVNTFDGNKEDSFNSPTGVFVSAKGELYIADSKNGRVVVLDSEGKLIKIFGRPDTPLIDDSFEYLPQKIAVDSADRINIVAKSEEKGIIRLESNGSFIGFVGAIPTPPDFLNSIVRVFGTKEMKQNMALNIATVYSNIAIDSADFIYGTVGNVDIQKYDISDMLVRKMNPTGTDVLKRYGNVPVWGDGYLVQSTYPSFTLVAPYMCDIAFNDIGIYSILEQRTGRVFSYDDYGNLLFTFGGKASVKDPRMGQFGLPVALDYLSRNEILVVDGQYNQLILFKLTEYGNMIVSFVEDYKKHNYGSVEGYVEFALKYTSKSELLYNNIGRYYYKKENYDTALKYFELAENRSKYSDAFRYSRKLFMKQYFSIAVLLLVILLVLTIAVYMVFKRRQKRGESK